MPVPFKQFLDKYLSIHVILPILIVVGLAYVLLPEREVYQPPGVVAPIGPMISPASMKEPLAFKSYNITPLADYETTARVIAKRTYFWESGADLAPVDLLLGWKDMSNGDILKFFSFSLSGRWYSWHANTLPLSEDEIENDLDNNHLIPDTRKIASAMRSVRAGSIVHIKGFLVSATGKDGYHWNSSLSLGSTGGRESCKLIYVTKFEVVK